MPNILNIPLSGTIFFSATTAGTSTVPSLTGQAVSLAHDNVAGLVVSSLNTATSATNRFRVNGANGALLAVTDEVTGTVFSVNDPAGLPIISADTGLNDVITIGTFGSNALVVRNDRVGIGTSNPNTSSALEIASTTRGFLPPRMTSTQRNTISGATVPSGLTVFNSTDNALSVYTTVLSSWDNIFTTRQGSFDASILRNACSNDTGTGNLVFSANPTFESAFVGGILNISGNLSASGALSASSITLAGNLSSSGNVRASSVTVLGSLSASGNITSNSRYVVSMALSASLTSNSGTPSPPDTQLIFPLIKLDPSSWTSVNGSNTRITPTIPGYYSIIYQLAWEPGIAGSGAQNNIQIVKGGTTVSLAQRPIDDTPNVNNTQVTTALVYMNGTTDYVTFQAYSSNTSGQQIFGETGGTWTKVEMFKIN